MKGSPAEPKGQKPENGDGEEQTPTTQGHEDEVQYKGAKPAWQHAIQRLPVKSIGVK